MTKAAIAEPCPSCGSKNIRWRRPRPLDVPLTWASFLVDYAFGGAGHDQATAIGGPGMYGDTATSKAYGELRERFEIKVGLKVADAFWKCPDCRKSGGVSDLAALGGDVALLSSMEGTISQEGGGVSSSIGGGPKGP